MSTDLKTGERSASRVSWDDSSSRRGDRTGAQWFALPEIFPEQRRLLVDVQACTALLLNLDNGPAGPSVMLVDSFHLTPSAGRVLLALLQAYPHHCPYQTLFAALYPASQAPVSSRHVGWELHVRPLRRAIRTLGAMVQSCGIEVVALRERGYVLAPARASLQHGRAAGTVS